MEDVDRLLRAGADKVGDQHRRPSLGPELVGEIAERFGSQVLVLSVDARRCAGAARAASRSRRTADAGRPGWTRWSGRLTVRELGAGEILLNSMDADGTKAGFDLELIAAVRAVVDVPLVASGGAGAVEHFAPAVDAGADAVLAASVFHFGELRIGEVKDALRTAGHVVR